MNNPTPQPEPGLPELLPGHRFLTPEEKLRPLPEGAMVWTVDEWEPTLSPGRVVDNCLIYCIPTTPENAQEPSSECTNHFADGSKIFPQRDCCRATPADTAFEQIRELRCAHADAIARAETAERDLAKTKERACGCVKCVCEDEEQCQGCGATECSYHNQLRRGLERDLATAREELRLSIEYRDSELDKAHQQLATLRDENAGLRAEIARLTLNKEGAIDLAIHGGHQLKATIADRHRAAERELKAMRPRIEEPEFEQEEQQ